MLMPLTPFPDKHRSDFFAQKSDRYDKTKNIFLKKYEEEKIEASEWQLAAHQVLTYFYPLYFKTSSNRKFYSVRKEYKLSEAEEPYFQKILTKGLQLYNEQLELTSLATGKKSIFEVVDIVEAQGRSLSREHIYYLEYLFKKRDQVAHVNPLDFDRMIKCMITFHPNAYIKFVGESIELAQQNEAQIKDPNIKKTWNNYVDKLSKIDGRKTQYVLCNFGDGKTEDVQFRVGSTVFDY